MPRYDDRYGGTRLYVGHLSSRTRTRDLEDIFSRYGRVRDVDMKRDYAFIEFSDPRDADDARYGLNGRDIDGSRIVVEVSRGVPRGPGGARDFGGRGPLPGSGRCFNCGIDGHWARDCKSGDWKNKCYRCGERGHVERNCQNSPKKLKRGRSYSRSPSPRRGKSRSRSFSRSRSYSRSRSPPARRERAVEHSDRSRSPRRSRSPKRQKASPPVSRGSPPVSRGRKHSPTPEERSPRGRSSLSPRNDDRHANGSDYGRSRSPAEEVVKESPREREDRSPVERSVSPVPRKERNARDDDENDRASPRGSE